MAQKIKGIQENPVAYILILLTRFYSGIRFFKDLKIQMNFCARLYCEQVPVMSFHVKMQIDPSLA